MSDITVVNEQQILAALNNLLNTVENPSLALLEIATNLIETTKERFVSKVGPDGVTWAPNSEETIAIKGRDDPLVDIGTLSMQFSYEIHNDGFDIFNAMTYAAMQQFGGTKDEFPYLWGDIPARPFLGVSAEDSDNILQILNDHISDTWH